MAVPSLHTVTNAMYLNGLGRELEGCPPPWAGRLYCRLDGLTVGDREEKRRAVVHQLGLEGFGSFPLLEEAVQTVARTLDVPICWLAVMEGDRLGIKAAVGLSHLGLMNSLASTRTLERSEAFCTQVVDSTQALAIPDTLAHSFFASGKLAQVYGLRAYLGTPLFVASGQCVGALAVVDLSPRNFSHRDLEFMAMAARWCMGEFERDWLYRQQGKGPVPMVAPQVPPPQDPPLSTLQFHLLTHLATHVQPPLTAVVGMSSVLKSEVFGSLSPKQKEYISIIHRSGEQIQGAIAELLSLEPLNLDALPITLTPLNIELLAQQIINQITATLGPTPFTVRISGEPGKMVWLLDKKTVKYALYYLLVSFLDSLPPPGELRLHLSRQGNTLTTAVWIYHPNQGQGLPQVPLQSLVMPALMARRLQRSPTRSRVEQRLTSQQLLTFLHHPAPPLPAYHLWGVLLSLHLCEHHGGEMAIEGSPDAGYRYVLRWPKIGVPSLTNLGK